MFSFRLPDHGALTLVLTVNYRKDRQGDTTHSDETYTLKWVRNNEHNLYYVVCEITLFLTLLITTERNIAPPP